MKESTHYVSPGVGEYGRLFVTIKVRREDGITRLSITGVEGPRANGDAKGSCGQCVEALDHLARLSPGWDVGMVQRLKTEWERWHLNDMRAGCEHQRKAGWDTRPIDPARPASAYVSLTRDGETRPYFTGWNMLTWITRKEHPEGLLSEPCEVCGYKYGTAWLKEDVPGDVIAFLGSLPQDDSLPFVWKERD
jgi:hypothetical protein